VLKYPVSEYQNVKTPKRREEMAQPIRTQLRLPAILYEAVRERAHTGRQSRNQFMVEAIRKEIEGKRDAGE
jgi:metal-responsive CopG/Arc/MetJ family transcriptional regulator